MVKYLPAMLETRVRSLGQEDPLEKEMATHSSTLSWRIPWTEGPGRLLSMGSQRVGHNWTTLLTYLKLSCFKETGGGVISQFFCPSKNTSNYKYQKISKHPLLYRTPLAQDQEWLLLPNYHTPVFPKNNKDCLLNTHTSTVPLTLHSDSGLDLISKFSSLPSLPFPLPILCKQPWRTTDTY